jgi:hypothetical protein
VAAGARGILRDTDAYTAVMNADPARREQHSFPVYAKSFLGNIVDPDWPRHKHHRPVVIYFTEPYVVFAVLCKSKRVPFPGGSHR